MIVKIKGIPEIPILDEWPSQAKALFKGLVVQALEYGWGPQQGDLISRKITDANPEGVAILIDNIIDGIMRIDASTGVDLQLFVYDEGYAHLHLCLSRSEVRRMFCL